MKTNIEEFGIGQTVKHNLMPILNPGIVKKVNTLHEIITVKWSTGNHFAHPPSALTIMNENNPNNTFKKLRAKITAGGML